MATVCTVVGSKGRAAAWAGAAFDPACIRPDTAPAIALTRILSATRVAPVRERMTVGVPVAVAGGKCRDAFHAYRDHGMLDPFRAVRILPLDHPLAGAPPPGRCRGR